MNLPDNPTKDQEIACWEGFVKALPPNTYLRSMFAGTVDNVAIMIRNDFAFDPLPELTRRRDDLRLEVAELERRRDGLRQTVAAQEDRARRAENDIASITNQIARLREQARRIANA